MSDEPAGITESQIRSADPQLTLNVIDSWPQSAQRMADHGDAYEGAVRAPEWDGVTAGAVITTAGRHNATIADDKATIEALHRRATAAMEPVIRTRAAVLGLIDDARATNQFTVTDDLKVTADDLENRPTADSKQMQIRQAAQKWADAETNAASEIRAGAQPLTGRGSRGGVQLVDHNIPLKPPPPPPPDPVTALGLPHYNPGSLSNEETRTVYTQGELRMRQLNDELIKQGVGAEERAHRLFDLRNSLRSWTRSLMSDRAAADQLSQFERNLTWEDLVARNQAKGLSGSDLYNAIADSSTRSRPSVNEGLGINPENPPPLPPVRPSAPVEAAAPPAAPEPPAERPVPRAGPVPEGGGPARGPLPEAGPPLGGGGQGGPSPGSGGGRSGGGGGFGGGYPGSGGIKRPTPGI